MPSRFSIRPRISPAALFVTVTARMLCGEAPSAWISQTIRWVRTRVLPLPAPASTSTGPSGAVTAARCASLRGLRIGDKSMKPCILRRRLTGRVRFFGGDSVLVRQVFFREVQQSGQESEQNGSDHEAENAEGGGASDGADEYGQRRDFHSLRGEKRA